MKTIIMGTALFAGCIIASCAHAQWDRTDLLGALKNGNAPWVEKIIHANSISPRVAQLAYAQLNYDVPKLLKFGKSCQAHALKDHGLAATTKAFYCYSVALSAATSIGDGHAFLSELLWYKTFLLPRMNEQSNYRSSSNTGLLPGVTLHDLKAVVLKTPPLSMEWQAESKIVPVNHGSSFSSTEPKIDIDVNGHSTVAMIDTRLPAPSSIIVVKPQSDKVESDSNLGLVSIYPSPSQTSVHTSNSGLEWKVANAVTIGPLVLHHLLVLVDTNSDVPAGIYIKNALLRRFGEVVIGKASVSFFRHSTNDCGAGASMIFAADENLNGFLKFPISVDGRSAMAAFYSDNQTPFQTAYGVLPTVASSTGTAKSTYTTRQGPIRVKVGSETFEAPYAVVANQRSTGPVDALIGNPVLQSYSVHLIFDRPSPMICLSRANQ